ncbi:hypothetical protein GCM10007981_16590 [Thermocladium modestius]|uniref:Uncharacterized protein n=1 Tax=Thermocladium modestius TaxID=62609 RepID=A0A830GXW8_9CREN|nr:hypothetical protein [Thermocladium modestius]GGP22025.1 hypothetical protein GCM10007981_16590 [Thermocladium modestius]
MSSLERLYGVMKDLDEAVDAIDSRKKEAEKEMEELLSSIKSRMSDDLSRKISQLISEYRESIDSRAAEEVRKYVEENSKKIERLRSRREAITKKAVDQVMSLLGFS